MSSVAPASPVAQLGGGDPGIALTAPPYPNMEQKILKASAEADAIIAEFSPAVANLVAAGIAIEPVISGLLHLIPGVFHHHTGVKKP